MITREFLSFVSVLFWRGIQLFIAVCLVYLIWVGQGSPSGDILVAQSIVAQCPAIGSVSDVLSQAQQLGRLDFISMLLAVLGVGLVLVTFPGFWIVQREAKDKAAECATNVAKDKVKELVPQELERYLEAPQGAKKLENIVNTRVSAIMEDEKMLQKLADMIVPRIESSDRSYDTLQGYIDFDEEKLNELLNSLPKKSAPKESNEDVNE